MRWRTVVTVGLVVSGLGLAGCGGDDGLEGAVLTTQPEASPSTTLTATTAVPPTTTIPTTTAPPTTTVSTTAPPTTTVTTVTVTEPPAGVTAELTITVIDPVGAETVLSVDCPGDGSTVCARLALDSVRSRLVDGPPLEEACTMQFGSAHQARIVGTLDGVAVNTSFARNDGCAISDWDGLMSGILPAVGGG